MCANVNRDMNIDWSLKTLSPLGVDLGSRNLWFGYPYHHRHPTSHQFSCVVLQSQKYVLWPTDQTFR